jgi:hypothetical protein
VELDRVAVGVGQLLSTLRWNVEGLDGELEVVARLENKAVKLRGV